MKDRILEAAGSARELEALYRGSPADFVRAFPDALKEAPESAILLVWRERLFFVEGNATGEVASRWRAWDIWLTIYISLVAGTLAKLPQWFPALNADPENRQG